MERRPVGGFGRELLILFHHCRAGGEQMPEYYLAHLGLLHCPFPTPGPPCLTLTQGTIGHLIDSLCLLTRSIVRYSAIGMLSMATFILSAIGLREKAQLYGRSKSWHCQSRIIIGNGIPCSVFSLNMPNAGYELRFVHSSFDRHNNVSLLISSLSSSFPCLPLPLLRFGLLPAAQQ